MSKEMTPKESLQIIQDNLTPRTLAILTVEFNIVEQALDRLEQLKKEISNQSNLIERLNRLVEKAQQENQDLKQDVKDVLEDYKDAVLRMFKYAEVIEKFIFYLNKEPNRSIPKHSIKQVLDKLLKEVLENDK